MFSVASFLMSIIFFFGESSGRQSISLQLFVIYATAHTGAKYHFLSINSFEFDIWTYVIFLKNEILKMRFLWKLCFDIVLFCDNCDFFENCDFSDVIFVKFAILVKIVISKRWFLSNLRFWKCDFCEKCDFQTVNF